MRRLVLLGLTLLVIVAGGFILVAALSGDDTTFPDPDQPVETSVGEIVEDPEIWYRRIADVTARAVPVADEYLVLAEDGEAIVAQIEPNAVRGEIEPGEEVRVIGVVTGFDRFDVAELDRLLAGDPPPELREARTDLDGSFISAERVEAAG